MNTEWVKEIKRLAAMKGVAKTCVENFLGTVENNYSEAIALYNLEYDSRMYHWNAETVEAIRKGIVHYFRKVKGQINAKVVV